MFNVYVQYFGLKEDQVPLIVVQTNDGKKYLKPNLQPDEIAPWVKEYKVTFISPASVSHNTWETSTHCLTQHEN